MSEQIQSSSASLSVQAAIANPDEMALTLDAAQRVLLTALVDRKRMRPRMAPELATVLGLKTENLDWVSRLPCAHIWIEALGRHCCHRAILDPAIDGLTIGWIILNSLDLIVDGEPPIVRRRHPDYIIVEM